MESSLQANQGRERWRCYGMDKELHRYRWTTGQNGVPRWRIHSNSLQQPGQLRARRPDGVVQVTPTMLKGISKSRVLIWDASAPSQAGIERPRQS